jgi:hypothetical protein
MTAISALWQVFFPGKVRGQRRKDDEADIPRVEEFFVQQ